jgi:glycogen debranching enzyme
VDVLFRELWTPYGLRSLSPSHPAYKGLYVGSRRDRDAAYHQGTVWAWLAGPFVRAYLHAYGRSSRTLAHARLLLEPLQAHLLEYGLGSIAENFDGNPPYTPRACVAQAWSVAETLRTWMDLSWH